MDGFSLLGAIITITILVFSAILHEVAHGYVADRLGDPTARLMGRLTLDPRKHIDPFLSILLPLILYLTSPIIFGGAKPVPVDPFNLKDGRKDVALVSLAGPATNVAIAIIAALLLKTLFPGQSLGMVFQSGSMLGAIIGTVVHINLLLAVFNLLPIPPLDGSKIFSLILPEGLANAFLSLGRYGMFILLILLMFPIGGLSIMQIVGNVLTYIINILGL